MSASALPGARSSVSTPTSPGQGRSSTGNRRCRSRTACGGRSSGTERRSRPTSRRSTTSRAGEADLAGQVRGRGVEAELVVASPVGDSRRGLEFVVESRELPLLEEGDRLVVVLLAPDVEPQPVVFVRSDVRSGAEEGLNEIGKIEIAALGEKLEDGRFHRIDPHAHQEVELRLLRETDDA